MAKALIALCVAAAWPTVVQPHARTQAGMVISSGFGTRVDPVRGGREVHTGIDLPGRIGSPILAADDGVVRFAGWRGGYGMIVELEHPSGLRTRYGHLSRIVVHIGEAVGRGQEIAQMGSTGKSTGPHLHFEVRADGRPVDPLAYLHETGRQPMQSGRSALPFREAALPDFADRQIARDDKLVHRSTFAEARRTAVSAARASPSLPDGQDAIGEKWQ